MRKIYSRRVARPHFLHNKLYTALALSVLGCCIGVLSLLFAAMAYSLPHRILFFSYFLNSAIFILNLLPPVLLVWLFYFLFGRAWCAFLGSFLPVMAISIVNYYKIRLRADPFLAADLRLAAEAGNITANYSLEVNWLIWLTLAAFIAGLLFSIIFLPRRAQGGTMRSFGAASCLALMLVSYAALYTNAALYAKTTNAELVNPWSEVEVFVGRGCVYPFLYSMQDMFPVPPKGYDSALAAATLDMYRDADIPQDKQVSIMAIMLEAFSDFSDFPALSAHPAVAQVYAPWHDLQEQSISGNLITNIFAGGTVDTEWGFLTGYSTHDAFRANTDSYVWYLRGQGYQTFGSHPGHGWFYNRQNVNPFLGFEDYWFTENYYGRFVDPVSAIYHSDELLVNELFAQLASRIKDAPCFSFSVSYQNHGPYESAYTAGETYLSPENADLDAASCNILNNYLGGIAETITAMTTLTNNLEQLQEPVVLVLFGDHKPWSGNGNSVYAALGVDFNFSTTDGFFNYYATPYLIWANSAAMQTLGSPFCGAGGNFSPCFLMPAVFDQCAWEGPAFMQLSREMREITPLLHARGLYLTNGALTDTLPAPAQEFAAQFFAAQYYREQELAR